MTHKVLVTGASGFIASHIILQLLQRDFEVVGTVRKNGSDFEKTLKNSLSKYTSNTAKLRLVEIDLLDPYEKWLQLISQVDYVLHVASPFPDRPPKNDDLLVLPAVTSTLNILRAATEAKIQKVVLTSSSGAALYGRRKIGVFNEEDWTDVTNLKDTSAYYRSKTLAEKAAWEYVRKTPGAVRFSSVLPGFVLGPILLGSTGTSVNVVKTMLNGEFPAVPKVGFASVDVRSIADLHIKVMLSNQADNQRFAGSAGYLTFKDIAGILKPIYPDRKIPTGELPDFLVRLISNFNPTIKPILMDLDAKRELSSKKARDVLGWATISLAETVRDCAASLIEHKIV